MVGACNVDVKGRSDGMLLSHTSNPGSVEVSAGGVGRNVAENLARLGQPTILLSAVGGDAYGQFLLEATRQAGVDTSRVLLAPEMRSCCFVALMNHRGDLEAAVADMGALQKVTVDYLATHEDLVRGASFLVLDADIPEESLLWCLEAAGRYGVPVCVEPISGARARGLVPHLGRITMVTPNREEAEVLVGYPLVTADDIARAGQDLVARGVRWAILTLGSEGVCAASPEGVEFLPSISTVVIDTVGAGDALTAGTVWGLLRGLSFLEAVRRGIVVATLTLGSRLAVHPELCPQLVERQSASATRGAA